MTLLSHAELEFRAAGWTNEDGSFKDDMQEMICNNVLELISILGKQGHSGTTAPYTINLFKQLAMYEPIVPLTGEDWEWTQIDSGPNMKFQNKRCSHVFKGDDGQAYDSQGRVFWDWYTDRETGEKFKSHYTNINSRVDITFPYTPTIEYVESQPGD